MKNFKNSESIWEDVNIWLYLLGIPSLLKTTKLEHCSEHYPIYALTPLFRHLGVLCRLLHVDFVGLYSIHSFLSPEWLSSLPNLFCFNAVTYLKLLINVALLMPFSTLWYRILWWNPLFMYSADGYLRLFSFFNGDDFFLYVCARAGVSQVCIPRWSFLGER